jgi:hypothetical protein
MKLWTCLVKQGYLSLQGSTMPKIPTLEELHQNTFAWGLGWWLPGAAPAFLFLVYELLMGVTGLEPARLSALAPKASVSAFHHTPVELAVSKPLRLKEDSPVLVDGLLQVDLAEQHVLGLQQQQQETSKW